ncbi:hypothetical protein [Aquimarina sp. AU119]|uniref:hypothetical protein n=1 Tax=Aquimarina sp. AU119 TaxID=2108528 RepID=UPI000D6987C1|nr:hypothetical protein [Aquimarina sp. AU119]
MKTLNIIYVNELGAVLVSLQHIISSIRLFDMYIYIPIMTLLSFLWFKNILKSLDNNKTFDTAIRYRFKKAFLIILYSLCFLVTNSTIIALKALIMEEVEYTTPLWFRDLIGPLHFFISSVALAHIWLIRRNYSRVLDYFLCFYIQIGLLVGFIAGFYCLLSPSFGLLHISTILILIWLALLNTDIILRLLYPFVTSTTVYLSK